MRKHYTAEPRGRFFALGPRGVSSRISIESRDERARPRPHGPDARLLRHVTWGDVDEPDRLLKVWDLESGRTLATVEGHADSVLACVVTPDGRRVVSASADQTLKVWDFGSRRTLATLTGHIHWVLA
jgi:WD40 repeat protein